ncbi:MAG: hypothetical protein P4L84_25235 [Isosphaeraceae bacterium]|nr:hypothetical protein [Isosphaeraceae bacterium]
MYYESGVGDVRGGLSCLDLLLVIHHDALRASDRFVVSESRFVVAYYVTLWTLGKLTDEDLCRFHKDGSRLNQHPLNQEIDHSAVATGGYSSGLDRATGLALAKQMAGKPGRVYCLTSGRQWQTGECWAGLSFAHRKRLENLTVLAVPDERKPMPGGIEGDDVFSLAARFRAFGTHTREIDGCDPRAIRRALRPNGHELPQFILALTPKEGDVSFLEHGPDRAALPLSEVQYRQAVREIEEKCAKLSASRSLMLRAVRNSHS